MRAETKEELRNKAHALELSLASERSRRVKAENDYKDLDNEHKKLLDKLAHNEEKENAEYSAWLKLNRKFITRFIKENISIETEVEYDYYGRAGDPQCSICIKESNE